MHSKEWSWDFIFIPEGQTKTFAEFSDEEKWKFWDDSGYLAFAKHLKNKEIEKEKQTCKKQNYTHIVN